VHTYVDVNWSQEIAVLVNANSLFSLDLVNGETRVRFTSYNLAPYNMQVINTKYFYFQSLHGLSVLNLTAMLYTT
jgi:hypothetical protein